MKIEKIAKRIYEIRKAIGYSTREQRAEGFIGEVKFIKSMIKNLEKDLIHSSGGFSFKLSPSGKSIIITPDFRFILKLK